MHLCGERAASGGGSVRLSKRAGAIEFHDFSREGEMGKPAIGLTQEQLRAIPWLLRATSFEEGCRRA